MERLNAFLTKEIRARMEARGWKVRQLERQAGLNERAVLSILQGHSRHPRIDTVAKIAKALDCTVSELIGEVPSRASDIDLEGLVYDLVLEFLKWSREPENRLPENLTDADCEYIADAIASSLFDATPRLELSTILARSRERAARVSARRRDRAGRANGRIS